MITVGGYCLDISRFEESLNKTQSNKQTFKEQGIRFEEWINAILEIPAESSAPWIPGVVRKFKRI